LTRRLTTAEPDQHALKPKFCKWNTLKN